MKNQTIEKNQIQIFNHEQFGEITIIRSENGKVLFKANDVEIGRASCRERV